MQLRDEHEEGKRGVSQWSKTGDSQSRWAGWLSTERWGRRGARMDRYGQTCDDGAGEGGAQGSADSHLLPPSKGET